MIGKELDDYRYDKETGEVVHIKYSERPEDYDPKNKQHQIRYCYVSNHPEKNGTAGYRTIGSGSKWFWCRYKRISKIKAKLLW